MLRFGRLYIVRHQEGITSSGSLDISHSVFTAEQSVWAGMYQRDRYARDRVMKSARLLLPFLKDGDTVLDVGCFTQEARKYYSRTINYIGIDEKRYHPQTIVVDFHRGFEKIPASHALCLETLEHVIDPGNLLESIYNSLPSDGVLVCSVPNEATIFHRLRCLCGTVDAECFSSKGKHIHLPSLRQARSFLSKRFEIVSELYYISPSAEGSRQSWVGNLLKLIPDVVHQWMADKCPSLFSRGFIFVLKKAEKIQVSP